MFEIEEWDGLAKLGKFKYNSKIISTPALFPVVDPKQQISAISEMKTKFGFNQVITSAYLMSKRVDHTNWEDYPKIRNYLDFDGMIMMDSGAYQVMLYGDIELGLTETITLQSSVDTDIGVIMDHPIGYDVSYQEAKERVDQTLENTEKSIPLLQEHVNWTLPIQGGKYLDLLEYYLKEIESRDLIKHFNFFALGSVVQVMINQDYSTLVEMIALARKYLPEDRPLHLFGAGHPAVFALATFLGCDTFDSAAYTLMAKDNRYMTVEGTFQLEDLIELPCSCPVCMDYSAKELQNLKKSKRRQMLAEHNLYVSAAEIKLIKQHIHDGNLWDLVLKRANAVPNLALATQRAIEIVTEGELTQKYTSGIPVSKNAMIRVTRSADLKKPLVKRMQEKSFNHLQMTDATEIVILAFPMHRSIYGRIPDYQVENYDNTKYQPALLLPPVGLISLGASEVYPLGQMINEIPLEQLPVDFIITQLRQLLNKGKKITIYYADERMNTYLDKFKSVLPEVKVELVNSVVTEFINHTKSN